MTLAIIERKQRTSKWSRFSFRSDRRLMISIVISFDDWWFWIWQSIGRPIRSWVAWRWCQRGAGIERSTNHTIRIINPNICHFNFIIRFLLESTTFSAISTVLEPSIEQRFRCIHQWRKRQWWYHSTICLSIKQSIVKEAYPCHPFWIKETCIQLSVHQQDTST